VRAAQRAGAAAVLVANDMTGGFVVMEKPAFDLMSDVRVPSGFVPASTGETLHLLSTVAPNTRYRFVAEDKLTHQLFDHVAQFSSVGPALDGRLKPELAAPGSEVASACVSGSAQQCNVCVMSGTSMATPLLAGTAALVRA
jgi:subtilisin family serine protease